MKILNPRKKRKDLGANRFILIYLSSRYYGEVGECEISLFTDCQTSSLWLVRSVGRIITKDSEFLLWPTPMKSLWNLSLLIRVSMFDFSVRNRKEFLPYLDESFQEVLKLIQVWTSCVLIGRWMISKPFELKWCGKHCPLRRCLDIQSTLEKNSYGKTV